MQQSMQSTMETSVSSVNVPDDLTLPTNVQSSTIVARKKESLNNRFYRFMFGLANSDAPIKDTSESDVYFGVKKGGASGSYK